MKKTLAIIAIAAGVCGFTQAGGGKIIAPPAVAPPAPCYGAGYEFGIFGAGFLPSEGDIDDALGGGVSLGYFFNENFGIDAGAAWYATDSTVHNYTLDAVYRLPMDCIAPYIFGGPGIHANSHTEILWRLGGGVDFRINDTTSVFADGSYNWVGGDVENYTIVRAGLRFAF